MRKWMIGLSVGLCGLAASAVPGLACAFQTQAAADAQTQQQTAQAQPATPTTSQ